MWIIFDISCSFCWTGAVAYCIFCRLKAKSKKLEREAEKYHKIGEQAELRCTELERELDALKAQRNANIQQFEQLKKQFTDILV